MQSSLVYEILLFLNTYYLAAFVVCEAGLLAYKATAFGAPNHSLLSEVAILAFTGCVEAVRILFGRKGNLTERGIPVAVSIGLTIPAVLGVVYFLVWQMFIFRLDWILCWVELILQSLEVLFAALHLAPIYKKPNAAANPIAY